MKEPFNDEYQTAGRVVAMRKMGKASFCHIQDEGHKIQIYLNTKMLEDGLYDIIVRNMDIGDIVGLKGSLFFTKTGELTL